MFNKIHYALASVILGVATLAPLAAADAGAILRLTATDNGGTQTVEIYDNTAADPRGEEGVVQYNGSLRNFDIQITTGVSYPVLGSATQPYLELNNLSVTSDLFGPQYGDGGGTLTLEFSVTGFTTTGSTEFDSFIAAQVANTLTYETYLDTSNAEFGKEILLSSSGDVGSPGATFYDSTKIDLLGLTPFSLTQVITLSHLSGAFYATSSDATLRVLPEPGTLAILGVGLAGLGMIRRRRRVAA